MGYPLSQTLFTSIYINRLLWPEPTSLDKADFHSVATGASQGTQVVQRVLRAYCLGTIKACDFVHSMVSDQHYYEVRGHSPKVYQERSPILTRLMELIRKRILRHNSFIENYYIMLTLVMCSCSLMRPFL